MNPTITLIIQAGFDGGRARTTWERLPEVLPAVGDESLDRRTLNDDYQQLFLCVVLEHARRTLEELRRLDIRDRNLERLLRFAAET